MIFIKKSVIDEEKLFYLNGLDYEKGLFKLYYNKVNRNSDNLSLDNIRVGIRSIEQENDILTIPANFTEFTKDGVNPYSSFNELILDLSDLLGFENGGRLGSGINIVQRVNGFSDLEAGEDVGDLAFVENSEGTQWLPNSLGGTYYPSGWYLWNDPNWVSDKNAIANQLEQSILDINNHTHTLSDITDFEDYEYRVKVKQASDLQGVLDSNKIYVVDGKIDMGSIEIEVPSGGLFIEGFDYFVSCLYSSEDNHTMFKNSTGQAAGNFKLGNISIYSSGNNSKIFELDNQLNFGAIEFNSVNIGDFSVLTTEIGQLNQYRQFRTNDCAFIRIGDGLNFGGVWAGGFRITDTILLAIPANTSVFKEGVNLNFLGSSLSDLNAVSIDNTTIVFDFQDSNFSMDEGFSMNGARFNISSNPVPNMTLSSTKRNFSNCTGVTNTFEGAKWELTTQQETGLTLNTLTKLEGVTTYSNLVYFGTNGNNSIVYNSSIIKDYVVSGQLVIDGGANDDIEIIVRKWNNLTSSYTDESVFLRRISNIVGGLDIAYFNPYTNVSLNINDRIEIWVRNITDNTNVTLLEGSFINIISRN